MLSGASCRSASCRCKPLVYSLNEKYIYCSLRNVTVGLFRINVIGICELQFCFLLMAYVYKQRVCFRSGLCKDLAGFLPFNVNRN